MDIRYENISKDEKDQIREFLLQHYFPDDQILLATDRSTPSTSEVEYIVDILDEGLSIKAVDNGEICGIILNGEIDQAVEHEFRRKIEACCCEHFKKILEFYLSWERDTHFWEIVPYDKAFSIHVIAVKSSYRRKGIMKALVNRTVECAKQRKHTLVTVDCSSFYTAKYFQMAGWNCIFALPFVHFKDNQGNPIFVKKNSPHLHVTSFLLQIQDAEMRYD